MSTRDIDAFVRLIRDHFPTTVFLHGETVGEKLTKWDIVSEPAATRDRVYAVVHAADWDVEQFCAQPCHPHGSLPRTYFSFRKSLGPFTHTLANGRGVETLNLGGLYGGYARSDKQTARFLARVWRASQKITTNRTKEIDPETGITISPLWKYQWCGFDALRWCQERENRVLYHQYRPTDDWVMPDSPYYD